MEHVGPQLILGMPALQKQGIIIDCEDQKWMFKERAVAVAMLSLEDFEEQAQYDLRIFMLHQVAIVDEDDSEEAAIRALPPELKDF